MAHWDDVDEPMRTHGHRTRRDPRAPGVDVEPVRGRRDGCSGQLVTPPRRARAGARRRAGSARALRARVDPSRPTLGDAARGAAPDVGHATSSTRYRVAARHADRDAAAAHQHHRRCPGSTVRPRPLEPPPPARRAELPARELVTTFGHGEHTCPAQPFSLAAMCRAAERLSPPTTSSRRPGSPASSPWRCRSAASPAASTRARSATAAAEPVTLTGDAPENPARWAPDPLGRHQYRYWDGTQWTEHVADNGVISIDPLTATAHRTGRPPSARSPHRCRAPQLRPRPPPAPRRRSGRGTAPRPHRVLGRRYGAFLIDAVICTVVFLAALLPVRDAADPGGDAAAARLPPGRHDSSRVECDNRAVITAERHRLRGERSACSSASRCSSRSSTSRSSRALAGGSLGKQMTGIARRHRRTDPHRRPALDGALGAVRGRRAAVVLPLRHHHVVGVAGHRRLGDMAANTYVVGRDDAGRPVVLP